MFERYWNTDLKLECTICPKEFNSDIEERIYRLLNKIVVEEGDEIEVSETGEGKKYYFEGWSNCCMEQVILFEAYLAPLIEEATINFIKQEFNGEEPEYFRHIFSNGKWIDQPGEIVYSGDKEIETSQVVEKLKKQNDLDDLFNELDCIEEDYEEDL